MVKKNKKTVFMILAYVGILIGIVLAFVFIMQTRNSNSVVEVYYATRNIDAGMEIDSTFEMNYLAKTEISKAVAEDIEAHGGKPVYSKNQLKSSASTSIPKGTILLESMFGDVINVSFTEKYTKEYGFANPYYTVLEVDTNNSPISGFEQDQRLSIEGTVDLANAS